MNGKALRALAVRRGCRVVRTADGHFKLYAPDGSFLGKIKATTPTDRGYFCRRLWKRLQALPSLTRPPAATVPPARSLVIQPALVAVDSKADMDVVPYNRPITWQEWMAAGSRSAARAVRRRHWRFEIMQSRSGRTASEQDGGVSMKTDRQKIEAKEAS